MASQDLHERPVPPRPAPPAFAARPTLLMHLRRTLRTDVWSPSRRQDGAVEGPQSDAMEVDLATEVRPHAPPPCAAPPRPRRSLGCSAHSGA